MPALYYNMEPIFSGHSDHMDCKCVVCMVYCSDMSLCKNLRNVTIFNVINKIFLIKCYTFVSKKNYTVASSHSPNTCSYG